MNKTNFKIGELYEYQTSIKNIFLYLGSSFDDYHSRTECEFLHLNTNTKFIWALETVETQFIELDCND